MRLTLVTEVEAIIPGRAQISFVVLKILSVVSPQAYNIAYLIDVTLAG